MMMKNIDFLIQSMVKKNEMKWKEKNGLHQHHHLISHEERSFDEMICKEAEWKCLENSFSVTHFSQKNKILKIDKIVTALLDMDGSLFLSLFEMLNTMCDFLDFGLTFFSIMCI